MNSQNKATFSFPESMEINIDALQCALSIRPPVTSGTVSVPSDQCVFYYDLQDGQARKPNFSNVSSAEVADLVDACQPATFGRNDEDVLDESYRKAGKLEPSSFATNVQLAELRAKVQNTLAEGTGKGWKRSCTS
ncbi:hypothetical protein BDV98DRAFT_312908 [Pterulicium gracile]|uniref:Uncharacterized protein n=1 Tax=Pterulicium gracile TaxID=1884261 RepID=A0A5C3QR30_9AGAR|nr:hypothetical protein BDV98DRAFT_312908 [Pterula gracilis]